MRDEKEFLAAMWQTVSDIEFEEQQKELARQRDKKLKKQLLLIYSSLAITVTSIFLLLTLSSADMGQACIACFIVILIGFSIDNGYAISNGFPALVHTNKNRRGYLENRD